MTDELYHKCILVAKKNVHQRWYAEDVVHDLILEKGDSLNEQNYIGLILTAIRNFNISNGVDSMLNKDVISVGICCKKCGDNLPDSEFRTTRNKRNGKLETRNTCKSCENKARNLRYHKKEKNDTDYKHRLYLKQKEYKSKNKLRKKIENRKYYLNRKTKLINNP